MESEQRDNNRKEEQLKWLGDLVVKAQDERFFGKLTVTFKDGYIDLVEKVESFKCPKS